MSVYVVSMPPNKLDNKKRVSGWRSVPLERTESTILREIVAVLKDKGVKCVYSSDLDEDAGRTVANELHCEFRDEYGLRRFNPGRHHASKSNHFETVLERVVAHWRTDPTVPVRGGDSLLSLERRLFKTAERICRLDDVAIVTDSHTATLIRDRTPEALLANGSGVKQGKVFMVKK